METIYLNRAIVVVGASVNVGLVHHELLRRLGVIPDAWGAPVTPTVMTPDAAAVAYRNGVSLLAQPGRLQVSATAEGGDPANTIAEVSTRLVRAAASGPLSAVGVNAVIAVPMASPGDHLAARFLRADAVPEDMGELAGFGCTISLHVPDATLTVAFQPVDQPASGIQVNANYHTVVDSVEDACAAVGRVDERMQGLPKVLSSLLGT